MLVQVAMILTGPGPLKIVIDSVIGTPVPQWARWLAPALARGDVHPVAAAAHGPDKAVLQHGARGGA